MINYKLWINPNGRIHSLAHTPELLRAPCVLNKRYLSTKARTAFHLTLTSHTLLQSECSHYEYTGPTPNCKHKMRGIHPTVGTCLGITLYLNSQLADLDGFLAPNQVQEPVKHVTSVVRTG